MCPPPTPHALASTPERHTRGPLHRPRRVEPPLGGSMRPCAAACLRGHTTWLGGVAAWFDGGFPWVQSRRALAHLSRRRREIRRSGALDGLVAQGSAPCAHALRASACATAEGAGGASARSQRAHIAHLCARMWTGKRLPDHTLGPHGARALVVLALRRRRAACWRSGAKAAGVAVPRGATPGANLGGARCMPRGRGRGPRAVARSQTCEDHTTTPRWRARARIVLSRRGRLVSGFGQKKEKSTTCEPSTLRRSVGSRPTRGAWVTSAEKKSLSDH